MEVNYNKNNNKETIIHSHSFMPIQEPKFLSSNDERKASESINVFTADGNQELIETSTTTVTDNATITYNIYLVEESETQTPNLKLIKTFDSNYNYRGYHREILNEKISLSECQKFAIVVIQKNSLSNQYIYFTTLSMNLSNTGYKKLAEFFLINKCYSTSVINKGESFIRYIQGDKSLYDLSSLRKAIEMEQNNYTLDNFPIYAYSSKSKNSNTCEQINNRASTLDIINKDNNQSTSSNKTEKTAQTTNVTSDDIKQIYHFDSTRQSIKTNQNLDNVQDKNIKEIALTPIETGDDSSICCYIVFCLLCSSILILLNKINNRCFDN